MHHFTDDHGLMMIQKKKKKKEAGNRMYCGSQLLLQSTVLRRRDLGKSCLGGFVERLASHVHAHLTARHLDGWQITTPIPRSKQKPH